MSPSSEAPYSIRNLFRRRVIPVLLLSSCALVAVTWILVVRVEMHIYMEMAGRRAASLTNQARGFEPETWRRLMEGREPAAVLASPGGQTITRLLMHDATQLKIYDDQGLTIFSPVTAEVGVREENARLAAALTTGAPQVQTVNHGGATYYEIYVPLRDGSSQRNIVFEIYEAASVVDEIILDSFLQAILAPLLLLLGLGWWLDRLTGRAQGEIDAQSAAQISLQRQLERFVSTSAVGAARSLSDGAVQSRRIGMSLFHSDVRDFSSLAEFHPPQEAIDFLNALLTIQVEAIRRHGGDIDKMIGDAVLARFEGADREARALRAAQDIQAALTAAPLARGIGIGIYDGEAILGAIGPEERQDFTAIGDSVNLAARLCSLAAEGEVVVDALALRRSGLDASAFSPPERNKVKGRSGSVTIQRWRPESGGEG